MPRKPPHLRIIRDLRGVHVMEITPEPGDVRADSSPRGSGRAEENPLLQHGHPSSDAGCSMSDAYPAGSTEGDWRSARSAASGLKSQWCRMCGLGRVALVLAALVTATLLLSTMRASGDVPAARKSSAIAVVPASQLCLGCSPHIRRATTSRHSQLHRLNALPLCGQNSKKAGGGSGHQLLVWSGKGKHEQVYQDLHAFDMQSHRWTKLTAAKHPSEPRARILGSEHNIELSPHESWLERSRPFLAPHQREATDEDADADGDEDAAAVGGPTPRWKEIFVQIAHPPGMLIYGGDPLLRTDAAGVAAGHVARNGTSLSAIAFNVSAVYPSPVNTSATADEVLDADGDAGGNASDASDLAKKHYLSDAWLLHLSGVTWEPAANGGLAKGPVPLARRAHTGVTYQENGSELLVIFGGRQVNRGMLADVWVANLTAWPDLSWRCLHDGLASTGDGHDSSAGHDGQRAKWAGPAPRKGHTAVIVRPDNLTPQARDVFGGQGAQMIIYGGRDDVGYFGDVWAFDFAKSSWTELKPEGDVVPNGRDHHSAWIHDGKMFVYGGRSGISYKTSGPVGSLLQFDLATRTWSSVHRPGPQPLPRFLFSSAAYSSASSRPDGTDNLEDSLDHVVVFGGEANITGPCYLNDVWELDLLSLVWSELSPAKVKDQWRCRAIKR